MDIVSEKFVRELLYNKSKEEILKILDDIDSPDVLYVYLYNYNWDEGFEIPKKILANEYCELSTALMMFYLADGERYFEDKDMETCSLVSEWDFFLQSLYNQIVSGSFKKGNISFKPPLSKVQLYKIKKTLSDKEEIFLKEIDGKNLSLVL